MTEPLNIISLGAGVQSSTMALMAAHGVITPMPDCAIFADTGAEPKYVYDWLDWLEGQLPFPVYRVMWKDGLTKSILNSAKPNEDGSFVGRFAGAPFYTSSNSDIGFGMLRRQCTREFKIQPITIKVRELLGLKPRQRAGSEVRAIQWIGISWDEKQRMKDPREKWLEHRWPLIEMHYSRLQCLEWMRDNGYNELPKKSACTYCPYRTNAEWRDMKENEPDAWEDAVKMDRAIRDGVRGTTEKLYVHRSATPLETADLSDPSEAQTSFLDECDGMCGV